MEWRNYIFKPSTLIAALISLIFLLLAFSRNDNPSFYVIAGESIKILCGALAGAVAGEKYVEKND